MCVLVALLLIAVGFSPNLSQPEAVATVAEVVSAPLLDFLCGEYGPKMEAEREQALD